MSGIKKHDIGVKVIDTNFPEVTIGIPVLNEEKYLEQTLYDVEQQDYPNIKVIIRDNASTDATKDICEKFVLRNDNFFYFCNERQLPAIDGVRKIIEDVKSDYFALLSGNNRVKSPYIRKCIDRLLANERAVLAYSKMEYIDKDGTPFNVYCSEDLNPDMKNLRVGERIDTVINQCGWYFYYCVGKTGFFRNVYLSSYRDFPQSHGLDVLVNLFSVLEGEVERVDETLYYYRRKYSDANEQFKRALGEDHQLSFPNAELSLNLISIIKNSSRISEKTRQQALAKAFPVFAHSAIWQNRFNLYSDRDCVYEEQDVKKRENLLAKLPFKPSDLFLKERRISCLSSRPRVAVLEFNHRHDEVIPAMVFHLNNMGYDVDVFLKDEVTYNNRIFDCFPSLCCNIHLMEDADGSYDKLIYWFKAFKLIEYEFIVINSLEPEFIVDLALKLPGRHFSVLHNPSTMMRFGKWQEYYDSVFHKPLFLHSMVTSKLPQFHNAACLPPFLPVEKYKKIGVDDDTIRFVIQGNIEPRRNYPLLLKVIDKLYLLRAELPPFEFHIIGNCTGAFGVEVRRIINKQPWKELVVFSEGELAYPDFYGRIAIADYLLPLLDKSESRFHPYFEDKLTSSVSVALMLNVPLVIHEELADIYGISGVVYNDDKYGLLRALLYALKIPEEKREKIRNELSGNRDKILEHAGTIARKYFDINNDERICYYQQEVVKRLKTGDLEGAKKFGEKLSELFS